MHSIEEAIVCIMRILLLKFTALPHLCIYVYYCFTTLPHLCIWVYYCFTTLSHLCICYTIASQHNQTTLYGPHDLYCSLGYSPCLPFPSTVPLPFGTLQSLVMFALWPAHYSPWQLQDVYNFMITIIVQVSVPENLSFQNNSLKFI
jgi:hypothetical protein